MSAERGCDARPRFSTSAGEGTRDERTTRGGGERRWAVRLIAVATGAALTAVVAPAATAAPVETVSTFSELSAAVVSVDDGGTIFVDTDIEMTGEITVPAGKTLTLTSDLPGPRTLTRSTLFLNPFFTVPDTAAVTITNLRLDGGATVATNPVSLAGIQANAPLVRNYGGLRLASGASLANNRMHPPSEAGGCVYNEGTLSVEAGATITGCWNGSYGGGAVLNYGTMDMSGGVLSGNIGTGGAIQNAYTGTARLSGGTIVGNADAYGVMDGGYSGIFNEGQLEVSSSIVVGDAADQSVDNTVLSPGSPVVVTGALTGHVSVAVEANPTDGQVIATGNNPAGGVYTLTGSDADAFSVRGYSTRLDAGQNAVVLTVVGPQVTDVDAAPNSLGSDGGDSAITITGTDLPATFEVAVFDAGTLTGIVATASTSGAAAHATLAFPQNTAATARVYTVRVSFDGVSWLTQPTADVTVAAAVQPTLADRDNNTISAPTQVTAGAAFSFTAHGDRQDAAGAVVGDERYVPSLWEINPSGAFVLDRSVYTATATVADPGAYTLTVTYVLQSFDGAVWTSTASTDTKTVGISSTAGLMGWNGQSLPVTGASGVLGWIVVAAAVAGAGVLLRGAARRVDR